MYDLLNIRPSPKALKLGVDYSEEEVLELFGPLISKNEYRYCFSDNQELVKCVEELWMIAHLRTQLPTTRIINKTKAQGIICEQRVVNWAMLGTGPSKINYER